LESTYFSSYIYYYEGYFWEMISQWSENPPLMGMEVFWWCIHRFINCSLGQFLLEKFWEKLGFFLKNRLMRISYDGRWYFSLRFFWWLSLCLCICWWKDISVVTCLPTIWLAHFWCTGSIYIHTSSQICLLKCYSKLTWCYNFSRVIIVLFLDGTVLH